MLIGASTAPCFTTVLFVIISKSNHDGPIFLATNRHASHHDGTTNFAGFAIKGGGS